MIKLEDLQDLLKVSQKQRTTTRTWTTKSGVVKTKDYVYSDNPLLFRKTKKGYKLIESEWNKFIENIKKTHPKQAVGLINEANRIKNEILHGETVAEYGTGIVNKKAGTETVRHYQSAGQKGWNRIDVKSMISRMAANAVEKYINNKGLSLDEILRFVNDYLDDCSYADDTDYGNITGADILNEGNWHGDVVSCNTSTGFSIKITIKWGYNGTDDIKITIG